MREVPVLGEQRPIALLIILLLVVVPTMMMLLRIDDPSRGQAPFGWQMHTTCWGVEDERCG